ncbi:ATP-binding protein [Nostoc sp. WHI]|uniref:ATP-binding protein n=1 Tax=Nostoc sp. WHI TaxID=2650611 RepID=UPI0018C80F70|nr:AAA family ATPase [Nostoc sp. WHI]MBG1270887.1 AAA family ATPase [Nostoc sp. WHI]
MITAQTNNGLQRKDQAWIMRIRLRAQRRILWMRSHYAEESSEFLGNSVITDNEINRILADPLVLATAEMSFYQHDELAPLTEQIHLADDLAAHNPAWQRLQQAFGLSAAEQDLLSLAIALEVDPSLRRVYGYLHDDATMTYPTLWLGSMLFQWASPTRLEPESGLVRWRLAYPVAGYDQPWSITAPWVADPAIVSWFLQGDCIDPALGISVQWLPASVSTDTCLYPDQLSAIQIFVKAMNQWQVDGDGKPWLPVPLEIELVGASGAGKKTLVRQVCAALNLDLIAVDASMLLGADVGRSLALERLMRVVRLAGLSGAVLYWHRLEEVNLKLWQSSQVYCSLTFFGVTTSLEPNENRAIRRAFHLPKLTRTQRAQLWQRLTNQNLVPDAIINWVLTPAEIHKATQVSIVGTEAVTAVCRQMLHQQVGELFTPLGCPYTWADLILPPAVRQHLLELEEQAQLRWQVYEEWGFGRLCPMGQGITALFAGPSGTGKTMAAQVLARSLGMELYRVDLAGVINKYIGETEKRLKQVFDACERANVLLFFDEADALFGQRTQVKDAHDRFANIEIDYLLQRMEQFDGIAVLATNRKSGIFAADSLHSGFCAAEFGGAIAVMAIGTIGVYATG